MHITEKTKIAALLKHHPGALEAIVSLSPDFEKLHNPILRKLMAGRASIAMAARIGGVRPEDFFEKLRPLGFEFDMSVKETVAPKTGLPSFLQTLSEDRVVVLDVRPVLAGGKDPLNLILQTVKSLKPGQVLKIVNTFEPTPLMGVLQKQGFQAFADHKDDKRVETWFYKEGAAGQAKPEVAPVTAPPEDWNSMVKRFEGHLQTVDVRAMEMPMPMMTILEALEHLPEGHALYVYHKRIPVFLLTELKDRKFDFRIKELGEGQVHLLIFKD
jgi:uncharacterized protein (DUF2249 family)